MILQKFFHFMLFVSFGGVKPTFFKKRQEALKMRVLIGKHIIQIDAIKPSVLQLRACKRIVI
ncbi:hypothetical protein, partial [Helicobacter pylori]|uniref:hypothetical protein n=1 Tax=Helicobacter pylori TaxID=210 RepID=UPI001E4DFB04